MLNVYLNMKQLTNLTVKQEIGATSLAINAINLAIGAGIFILPATVAGNLGSASFIAYIICGLLLFLIMLCYAEIGSKVTTSGGSYAYVEKAFGPLAGFLISILFLISNILGDAAIANVMVDIIGTLLPIFNITYIRVLFFISIYGFLAFVNIRGAKQGSQFAVAATILKLTPLLMLILVGFFSISTDNLIIKTLPNLKSVGETALILFFAFLGIESALNISGEIKNPKKNIPKGIFLGVAGILLIYLFIQFVAQGVLGVQLNANEKEPLALLAKNLIGPIGGILILATTILSILGTISGDILTSPRLLFAASQDKLIPDFLSRLHPKFATPYWSIILFSAATIFFAATGSFKQLVVYVTSSVLLIYLSVILATIRLRYKKDLTVPVVDDNVTESGFKMPGGLVIPVLAIATICWLLSHITLSEIIVFIVFFTVLILIYFINKFVRGRISFTESRSLDH